MLGVSVVILTTGDRWVELAEAIRSVRRQEVDPLEVVVVGNGTVLPALEVEVSVALPENLGIPEGRNRGTAASSLDTLCFLDDDASLLGDHVLASALDALDADPRLAAIGMRLVDDRQRTARRHDPRLHRSTRSSASTSFPGGACVVRRSAFEQVGGLAGEFFYALEETDLAWRLLDAGWSIRYDTKLLVHHERTDPRRHPSFTARTARNRVWLAHRNLPLPLAIAYLANWTLITCVRSLRHPSDLRAHFRGLAEGVRTRPGPRRPISWRTALRLTRLGRPPVL